MCMSPVVFLGGKRKLTYDRGVGELHDFQFGVLACGLPSLLAVGYAS